MMSLVTLHALSNYDLLIEKIKSKTFVLKKFRVYSKTRVVFLDPITDKHEH